MTPALHHFVIFSASTPNSVRMASVCHTTGIACAVLQLERRVTASTAGGVRHPAGMVAAIQDGLRGDN
jgi:hypothetical protein